MEFALEQLKALSFGRSRPVIISDADEVILHFADIFSEYLETQGMYVNFKSYAFEGNLKYKDSDEAVGRDLFEAIFNGFFENYVDKQPLVKNSAENLKSLSEICDIVIVTNIPHSFADRRRKQLIKQGINYPLITNNGPKGPILNLISKMTSEKLIFIDDVSHHHKSVAEHVPDSLRIQFIANNHLNEIEDKSEYCQYRCYNWEEIAKVIRNSLQK
ncbi:MAG: hypothetical protein COA93_11605 [Alphaproteobacteria bacterium]|nr:MAG: hypothetical protein COA93_11605 [Alphaproteobacteria bacterium]